MTGAWQSFYNTYVQIPVTAQVQARLDELTPPQLRKVRDYERRNATRKTVLAAIEGRLGT